MDLSQTIGSYAGYVTVVIAIIGTIYAAINHKRIRSKCCSKSVEISLDIENTAVPRPTGESAGATATVHGTSSAASLSKEVTPSGGAGEAIPAPAPKRRAGRPKKPLDPTTAEIAAAFSKWYAEQKKGADGQ